MVKSGGPKRPRTRLGRPPKDLAGDVRARILDAAEHIFLEEGFQSASVEAIAQRAPASKPTIYTHFQGKQALFVAVVDRIMNRLVNFDDYEPRGHTVQDTLACLGTEIVDRFIEDTVGVARATIAEAERFPELSWSVHEATRDRAARAVSELLTEATHLLPRAPNGPHGPRRSLGTAQIFMDLILLPMLMRALAGEDTKSLRKALPSFVQERVSFFLAAREADLRQ
jgi:AcrR family transcriptional regulator